MSREYQKWKSFDSQSIDPCPVAKQRVAVMLKGLPFCKVRSEGEANDLYSIIEFGRLNLEGTSKKNITSCRIVLSFSYFTRHPQYQCLPFRRT